MLSKTTHWLVAATAISFLVVGCGRDNGLPTDLTAHLAIFGVHIQASGSQAPLSSRAGFIFFDYDPAIEEKIVTEFRLEKVEPQDRRFVFYTRQIAEKPVSLRGISGRPATLKLKGGAQFENLYLLVTEKRIYLFSEYAYG